MKIEVWSDFMCPFCYIGETKLKKAIKNLKIEDEVEIEFKSYELDPSAGEWENMSFLELMVGKYFMPKDQALLKIKAITENAKEAGLNFDMDKMKPTNSFKAHRLCKFGKSKGKKDQILKELFSGYFEKGKNLSDDKDLIEIAKKAGLDGEETKKVLEDENAFASEVKKDEEEAKNLNIRVVPYYIIDRKYEVKGALPVETFEQALKKAMNEK